MIKGIREGLHPVAVNQDQPRFFARFESGKMELENEDNDLSKIKAWIAGLLTKHPSPDYVVIRDQHEDQEIFKEDNR